MTAINDIEISGLVALGRMIQGADAPREFVLVCSIMKGSMAFTAKVLANSLGCGS